MPQTALAHAIESTDRRADEFTFYLTDPDQAIVLAEDRQLNDANPTPLRTTYRQFFERLSVPDPFSGLKDGPGYMAGPCNGRRLKSNVPIKHLAVLDADSTLLPDGSKREGAPPPDEVHAALCSYGISHHIYSTYSNGQKGHRYRVLFPCHLDSPAQLRGLMMYLTDILQVSAGLPVYLTPESVRWGVRWHYPRMPSADAEFFHATYFANTIDGLYPARYYAQVDAVGNEITTTLPDLYNPQGMTPDSPIALFCELFSLPAMLAANGYTYCGQGSITTGSMETPILRFKPSASSSQAGVVVLEIDGRWRAYSHHTNDPLCNGYMNDVFDFCQLSGMIENMDQAFQMMEEEKARIMDEEYPVVMEGGTKYRVAKLTYSEVSGQLYQFITFEDFKSFLSDDGGLYIHTTTDDIKGIRRVHTADWWKSFKGKTKFHNTRFVPTPFGEPFERGILQPDGKFAFNLFRGWTIKTNDKADYGLIEWHLENVLCSGNERDYNYLKDWIAHLLQFPKEKPGVAIVMRGDKGTGKSLFWSSIIKAIGPLGLVISNSRLLTGEFNAHLHNRLLGLVEESFWAGNPADEGRLKHLITDHEGMTEKKGVDAFETRNYLRVILNTNNEWAVPASEDERRYFVPEISRAGIEADQASGNYFSSLALQLSGGGLEAFLTAMSKRRIDTSKIRRAPAGSGLQKQKLLSLSGNRAWIFDWLSKGYFGNDLETAKVRLEPHPKETLVDIEVLSESCRNYLGRHAGNRSQVSHIMHVLQEYFGEVCLTEVSGMRCVALPSIEVMRDCFKTKVGNMDFNWSTLK